MTGLSRRAARALFFGARSRAKARALPFDLTVDDINVPDFCPVLGIELIHGKEHPHDHSPTLDRIIPAKGYVKGNVVVISMRANRLKNNATIHELGRLARFYEGLGA